MNRHKSTLAILPQCIQRMPLKATNCIITLQYIQNIYIDFMVSLNTQLVYRIVAITNG